jgi:riboflavin biosynthesis pyrimidine reductase
VVTTAAADPVRRRALDGPAEVVTAGDERVDPVRAVAALRERGLGRVLVEGGPALNADWLAAGVVDELCLTLAPALVGEHGPRLAGPLSARVDLALTGLLVDGSEVLLRYAVLTDSQEKTEIR